MPSLDQMTSSELGAKHAAARKESQFQLVRASELFEVFQPPEYLVGDFLESGASAGSIAPPESGKSLLALNIAACLATGKPFHGRTVKPGLIVYLAGEGHRGIARRLQAIEQRYKLGLRDAPLVVSKAVASFVDPIAVVGIKDAIDKAVEYHGMPLVLLIVDTVARHLAPGNESKAQDMGPYLGAVDYLRGDATAISCHHPGHNDATRGRGSSSWRAGLNADYSVVACNGVVTVTCQKMKDGERPASLSFAIETERTLMVRAEKSPWNSVVLVPSDCTAAPPKLTGKNQARLLTVVADYRKKTDRDLIAGDELRARAKAAGIDRRRFMEALPTLERAGYLIPSIGGWRMQDVR